MLLLLLCGRSALAIFLGETAGLVMAEQDVVAGETLRAVLARVDFGIGGVFWMEGGDVALEVFEPTKCR